MTRPCRRSSRLQGVSATSPSKDASSTTKLSSRVERHESPTDGSRHNIDVIVTSPIAAPNTPIFQFGSHTTLRTPDTDSRFRPGIEEMHPSKVHRSTSKQIRSELQPISEGVHSQVTATESNPADNCSTPTKLPGSWPIHMPSSTFEFSIAQDDTLLSCETQKIMNSVRGEAAKIKAQMQAERAKQDHLDERVNQLYGVEGRKIAQPKGKKGRYSDAHMQEFKKMNSIADHASLWKNKIQNETTFAHQNKTLADFETTDPVKQLPRSKSFKVIRSSDDRLENLAPGKRSKRNYYEDTSAARPLSQGKQAENEVVPATPLKAGLRSGLPIAIFTPTKASLARSASVKTMKTSMIPSLKRSNSTKVIHSPVAPRTEGSNKYLSSLAKFGNMKSILHRQPKFSNDAIKVAAGTITGSKPAEVRLDKELQSLPSTPRLELKRSPTLTKRVEFTPSTNPQDDLVITSPSPSNIPASNLLRQMTMPKPSVPVFYPSLANSPNITTRTKIPRSSTPGDFTFESDKTIQFNSAPSSVKTPTIRQVRPSGITTPLPVFENLSPIPHGMPNKKRRRIDSDDEDVENTDPLDMAVTDEDEPKAKRLKSSPRKEVMNERKGNKSKIAGSGSSKAGGAKEKGKAVLRLSRLNILARPKNRH